MTDKVPEEHREDLAEYSKAVKDFFKNSPACSKPDLTVLAKKWGLPPSLADKVSENSLLALISTAAFVAA
jgi:hypothetical protein